MKIYDIILLFILIIFIFFYMKINSIKHKEGFIKNIRQPFRNFRLKRESFSRKIIENMTRVKRNVFGKGL